MHVDFDDDDTQISLQIDSAQAHLEQLLGYLITTEFPSTVPADLVGAVMQLAAHLYENREVTAAGVSIAEFPFGTWDVVRERRHYSF
ncbi:MAG: phage gp6-like head-tail connector protein [Mesorhizobium sp.]|uniref:head-tail connector protein n=1 Tax=unclassified Mesorhizobium TaxID=325217 RepID=UPI000FC9DA73|nr:MULTISPECIES: head-tail connector protein [unclassified Mesorhizobium]RUV66744.1 phage gp6-like head-tail connector protein [Mesorhizobium sp. M5C.F.Cr.IN.023.01.1.1]RWF80812.1 MAG: phage gp6-like head-tail connector protein [Mesorhizobium sp.]RWF88406.1 MAG: phage gp6-like head-tail connector protein [Mesorhizobium sp.]RWI32040.1 MAG: phage gp6-like head-tail connector protein [Mesorhizobium sp.]RWI41557.1 MAG: phage gp6-like head-tail connector protein [Mesorhizobium sp.]